MIKFTVEVHPAPDFINDSNYYLIDSWPSEYRRKVYCLKDNLLFVSPYTVNSLWDTEIFFKVETPPVDPTKQLLLEALAVAVHNKPLNT